VALWRGTTLVRHPQWVSQWP